MRRVLPGGFVADGRDPNAVNVEAAPLTPRIERSYGNTVRVEPGTRKAVLDVFLPHEQPVWQIVLKGTALPEFAANPNNIPQAGRALLSFGANIGTMIDKVFDVANGVVLTVPAGFVRLAVSCEDNLNGANSQGAGLYTAIAVPGSSIASTTLYYTVFTGPIALGAYSPSIEIPPFAIDWTFRWNTDPVTGLGPSGGNIQPFIISSGYVTDPPAAADRYDAVYVFSNQSIAAPQTNAPMPWHPVSLRARYVNVFNFGVTGAYGGTFIFRVA